MKHSFKEADLKPGHFTTLPKLENIFVWAIAELILLSWKPGEPSNYFAITTYYVLNFATACNFGHFLPLLTSLQNQCKDKIK